MAIHRKAHTKGYTVIDNEILRCSCLSSTAKMVLAIALSLPDDWSFNIRGLCTFCAEGPDAVANAIRELEKAGYIKRKQIRVKGKIKGMTYDIYETPNLREEPDPEKPDLEKSNVGTPDTEKSCQAQEAIPNTNLPITHLPNIYNTNDQSINRTDAIEGEIRNQIEYDIMCQQYDRRLLDDVVSVIVSAIVEKGDTISVGKDKAYPSEYVRSCLGRVNPLHIEQIMETLIRNQPTIRNVRAYLLTALINAANTMDIGYQFGEF